MYTDTLRVRACMCVCVMPVVNTATVVVAGVVRALLCYCMRYVLQTVNCVFANRRGNSTAEGREVEQGRAQAALVHSSQFRRRSRVLDLGITSPRVY